LDGDNDLFAHAAVDVDAHHFQVHAAVWLVPAAGDAVAAMQIGFDDAAIAAL
jgi:hypothetical protein